MKKKTKRDGKNKNLKIVVIIIIILIAMLAISLISKYKNGREEEENIKKLNNFFYESLSCLSDCPVDIEVFTGVVSFDKNCSNNCHEKANKILPDSNKVLMKIGIENKKLLINSDDFKLCKVKSEVNKNADDYKACLQEILLGLKEEYNIN